MTLPPLPSTSNTEVPCVSLSLPFSPAEFARRLATVRQAAMSSELDVLVLNSPENLYYLTGFQTIGYFVAPQFLIVPTDGEPFLVIRYGERSNVWARSWIQEFVAYRDTDRPVSVLCNALAKLPVRRVGVDVDSWFVPPNLGSQLSEALAAKISSCSPLLRRARAIKSGEELRYVEAAARMSSAAVAAGIKAIESAAVDRDIVAAIYSALVQSGSEYPPLPPLVTVGIETTLFHNTWSGKRLDRGDVVMIELTGVAGRYLAPLARSASRGDPPSYIMDRQKIAIESLESGIAQMRPGATCGEVYDAFAAPYRRARYELPIKAGYSVGLSFPPSWGDNHELDLLPDNQTILEPGMVFHTPRTVRIYGQQTPIFSETVVITDSGHKIVTEYPRRFVSL